MHREIIKLARKYPNLALPELVERFAALVEERAAAAEREACAQVCVDAIASIRGFGTEDAKQTGINVCNNLAAAIRERGN